MLNIHRPAPEQVARLRELLQHLPQDAAKRRVSALCVYGMWRGKDSWLVGYQWTRAVGTPRPDQVHEQVMGHAPKRDDAIPMLQDKLGALP